MKLGYGTNAWGGVVGHPGGVTSIKDAYYLANGSSEQAIHDIAAVGYNGFEMFDGNLMQFRDDKQAFRDLLQQTSQTFIGVYSGANLPFSQQVMRWLLAPSRLLVRLVLMCLKLLRSWVWITSSSLPFLSLRSRQLRNLCARLVVPQWSCC